MNTVGTGCSEPRLHHCIPAWVTEQDSVKKRKKTNLMHIITAIISLAPGSHRSLLPLLSLHTLPMWKRHHIQVAGMTFLSTFPLATVSSTQRKQVKDKAEKHPPGCGPPMGIAIVSCQLVSMESLRSCLPRQPNSDSSPPLSYQGHGPGAIHPLLLPAYHALFR